MLIVERVLYCVSPLVCTVSNKVSSVGTNCHCIFTSGMLSSAATCFARVICIKYSLSSLAKLKALRRFSIIGHRVSELCPTAHNIFFGLKNVTDVNVRGADGCFIFSELNV